MLRGDWQVGRGDGGKEEGQQLLWGSGHPGLSLWKELCIWDDLVIL